MDGLAAPNNHLLQVYDSITRCKYLVDTGAMISVLKRSHTDVTPSDGFRLQAANGSTIKTYGQRSVTLNIGLRRSFKHIFIIADVQQNIIGADFLSKYQLLVDMSRKRLIDQLTTLSVPTVKSKIQGTFPKDLSVLLDHKRVFRFVAGISRVVKT